MGADIINVLILDDDEDDTFLIEDTIEEIASGEYSVMTAHSPGDAFALMSENPFDVILCDYLMGATTGIEFIEQTRSKGLDTPIILLTGMGDTDTDRAALKAGAADFISKINMAPAILDRAMRYSVANARRNQLFQTVLENVNAGVVLVGADHTPTLWNPEFLELAEYCIETDEKSDAIQQFTSDMIAGDRILRVRDKVLEKKVTQTPDNGQVMLLHDVTEHIQALREREAAENKAAHLAMNCSLTGLPNRNAFSEKILNEIRQAEEEGYEFYLLNLDLNKFKEVNDVYGHNIGDKLLTEVSARLLNCCQDDDYVARIGGDEFMAIQRRQDPTENSSSLADRISQKINSSIVLDDTLIRTGVSIGAAIFPHHGRTPEELMSNADIAMYRAKADQDASIYAFNEEMDRKIRETRQIGQELRKAVANGEINAFFQPQASMKSESITGFEALARWNHPQLGPISPGVFIPLAEELGLISELGELVLRKACKIAAGWRYPLNVAVNISPVQIRSVDLVPLLQSILVETGLSAERLELEVTESVLIDDTVRALHVLRGIKNLGISIALDDFGTGFSSLSTLISFPFDKIKIDRSFVENCGNNHQAAVVTRTIINMAHQLGYRIIAEGVQNSDHVEFLLKEGCHEMQGYLFGKPVPKDEAEMFFPDRLGNSIFRSSEEWLSAANG